MGLGDGQDSRRILDDRRRAEIKTGLDFEEEGLSLCKTANEEDKQTISRRKNKSTERKRDNLL